MGLMWTQNQFEVRCHHSFAGKKRDHGQFSAGFQSLTKRAQQTDTLVFREIVDVIVESDQVEWAGCFGASLPNIGIHHTETRREPPVDKSLGSLGNHIFLQINADPSRLRIGTGCMMQINSRTAPNFKHRQRAITCDLALSKLDHKRLQKTRRAGYHLAFSSKVIALAG